jgi:hypothetical protein
MIVIIIAMMTQEAGAITAGRAAAEAVETVDVLRNEKTCGVLCKSFSRLSHY